MPGLCEKTRPGTPCCGWHQGRNSGFTQSLSHRTEPHHLPLQEAGLWPLCSGVTSCPIRPVSSPGLPQPASGTGAQQGRPSSGGEGRPPPQHWGWNTPTLAIKGPSRSDWASSRGEDGDQCPHQSLTAHAQVLSAQPPALGSRSAPALHLPATASRDFSTGQAARPPPRSRAFTCSRHLGLVHRCLW